MKRSCCIVAALVFLVASSVLASSRVTNIELSCQNGTTVARIDVDGAVRFSHQTEIAKDDKPFRVIVDVLKANHHLGAKKFLSLPPCAVSGIRTSQYAVQPEEVVRIVFDMENETAYRVEGNQQSVTVTFPDKKGRQFAAWSTSDFVVAQARQAGASPPMVATQSAPTEPGTPTKSPAASKSPAQVNAAIDKDRMASLGTTAPTPVTVKPEPVKAQSKQAPPVVAKAPEATPKPAEPAVQPKLDRPFADKPEKAAPLKQEQPAVMTNTKVASTPASFSDKDKWADVYEQPVANKKAPAPKVAAAPVEQPKPADNTAVKPTPKAGPEKPAKTVTAEAPSKKTSPEVAKVERPKDGTDGNVKPPTKTSQSLDKSTKPAKPASKSDDGQEMANTDESKKSTSRFRRTPTVSRKIKGTMIAEFPSRLVVKYKARAFRDPFETLINETQVSNDPIEQRIPNVEGLRLVGILESDGGKNRALLEDASGYGYILQGGDRVKKGYVLRIESDRIYFQIFEYGWSRTMALNLEG